MSGRAAVLKDQQKPGSVYPMSGVLQRKFFGCGNHTIAGGECETCGKQRLQTKLQVNEPGDAYEQEADRIADQVLAASVGATPRIQRFSGQSNGQMDIAPASVDQTLANSGRPLEPTLRRDMEHRFGHDFSSVRVRTDATAVQSAQDVNAFAYTVGHAIVFGANKFAPGTREGRSLLAHELTHVVQQQAPPIPIEQTPMQSKIGAERNTSSEHDGKRVSSRIGASNLVTIQRRGPGNILQRAAPAIGIGALAAKCIIGAIVGVLVDLGIQAAMNAWRNRTWRFWEMSVDYCSVILSAILGCIGGAVAAKWIEPWINSALGGRLGGIAGSLIGKILMFIAQKLAIGVPRGLVKTLLKLNCISREQAEALATGVGSELTAAAAEGPATNISSEDTAMMA